MRSLLIAFALLVPVFIIIGISGKVTPAPDIYHNPEKSAKISDKIKPAPTFSETVPSHFEPGSLEEEKWRLKKRLAELEQMTPQQWKKKKKDRIKFNETWKHMSHDERLEAIQKLREKRKRAPEVELAPAKPESDLAPAKSAK